MTSKAGFEKVREIFENIDKVCGAQLSVFHDGQEVFYDSIGVGDRARHVPMAKDTILRMYSMTKPVTAVVISALMERGLLREEDRLDGYFPEFRHMQVIRDGRVQPAEHAIRISNLLNMTSGIVYPGTDSAGWVMQDVFDDIQKESDSDQSYPTREVIRRISSVPLAFDPGEKWRYGLSADILAGVAEIVSGKSIRELYREILFEPLEMHDTDFYVPGAKQKRLAELYKIEGGEIVVDEKRHLGLPRGQTLPNYQSGGAGLYSTQEDYSHFLKMLLNYGEYKGRRVLDRRSVLSYAVNELSRAQRSDIRNGQMEGYGYGHLMRVNAAGEICCFSSEPGEFGWAGWSGPYFSVDLKNDIGILFTTQISGYDHLELSRNLSREIYRAVL